jgi:TolA-binding protein
MDDVGEELRDIKREIIESRGLVIKTNNLTNALAADLKSVAKRQIGFERRAFLNSAVVNVLFVVVVLGVVKLAWDARVESVERETRRAEARITGLTEELDRAKKDGDERTRAEGAAATFYELMRSGKKRELIDGYELVRKEPLTRAERAIFRDAVSRASAELSLAAYHAGLDQLKQERWHDAALAFEEALKFDDAASHTPTAQLQLARAYRRLNRQRDAIPMLVKLSEASADPEILDDAMYLLAECLIDVQAWTDAKTTLRSFIRRYPKSSYVNDAKMTLAEISLRH